MKDKGNVIKYYIDKSGNTTDLIMTEDNLNFSGQEYFTFPHRNPSPKREQNLLQQQKG